MKAPEVNLLKMHKDGMDYTICKPEYPLSIFIDHFMVAKGFPLFSEERLFPGNKIELFINLGSRNECKLSFSDQRFVFSGTILSGLRTSYLEIYPGEFFFIAGIRFSLFGFHHLLKIPANEITDDNFEASDVLGKELKELREKLGDHTDENQIIHELLNWTIQKIIKCSDVSKAWLNLENALQFDRSLNKISLDKLMGYSHKHTVELFKKKAGLSPKQIQSIYRLNMVFDHLHQIDTENWSYVLHEAGYYDQSHFIKDFKRFTGFTPTEFLRENPKDFELKKLR